jgi:hypothetical protein
MSEELNMKSKFIIIITAGVLSLNANALFAGAQKPEILQRATPKPAVIINKTNPKVVIKPGGTTTASEFGASNKATALLNENPNLDFDSLFLLVRRTESVENSFKGTVKAKALSAEEIIRTGARYHFSAQFPADNSNSFYPEPKDLALYIENNLHPSTTQVEFWSWSLLAGYDPLMLWRQVEIGEFEPRTMRPRNPLATCLIQNFTDPYATRPLTQERVVPIAIALDGSGSQDAGKANCVSMFLQSMRERAISRTIAAQLTDGLVKCVPAQAPTCNALRVPVIDSILQGAGYPPDRVR